MSVGLHCMTTPAPLGPMPDNTAWHPSETVEDLSWLYLTTFIKLERNLILKLLEVVIYNMMIDNARSKETGAWGKTDEIAAIPILASKGIFHDCHVASWCPGGSWLRNLWWSGTQGASTNAFASLLQKSSFLVLKEFLLWSLLRYFAGGRASHRSMRGACAEETQFHLECWSAYICLHCVWFLLSRTAVVKKSLLTETRQKKCTLPNAFVPHSAGRPSSRGFGVEESLRFRGSSLWLLTIPSLFLQW